jgi:hypothetical protein
MPVQRMPRYKMLLADLLKHTAESHPDFQNLKDALSMVSAIAMAINEKIRSSETTQGLCVCVVCLFSFHIVLFFCLLCVALLEDGRQKDRLSPFVTKERTVLIKGADASIKIDQAKSLLKLKADVYILSDHVLFLLRRSVRSDVYPWLDEFSHIFWPTRLIWVKKATLGGLHIGGPLFGITMKIKKLQSEFGDLLIKEMNKHKGAGEETLRTGVYAFHDSGVKYDGEWRGSVAGGFMEGRGSIALGLGMIYTGTFVKNEMTGPGKMKLPTGELLVCFKQKFVLSCVLICFVC